MASTWNCRECNTPITGAAHLRLGRMTAHGHTALCLTCADKMADKLHANCLHELVPAYLRHVGNGTRPGTAATAALKAQLAQQGARLELLERLLESVTAPEPPRKAG